MWPQEASAPPDPPIKEGTFDPPKKTLAFPRPLGVQTPPHDPIGTPYRLFSHFSASALSVKLATGFSLLSLLKALALSGLDKSPSIASL